jgi:hypothetical protein
MLEKEFKYYLDHQEELIKKYNDQYIVIVGDKVIGSYDTQRQAYDETIREHEEGTFLIQYCSPGEESYSHVFHSRISV